MRPQGALLLLLPGLLATARAFSSARFGGGFPPAGAHGRGAAHDCRAARARTVSTSEGTIRERSTRTGAGSTFSSGTAGGGLAEDGAVAHSAASAAEDDNAETHGMPLVY